jgi:hypothetical protein
MGSAIIHWLELSSQENTPSSKNTHFLSWNESTQALKSLLQNPADPNWVHTWQNVKYNLKSI